jgi:hypothetical protein
MMLLNQKDGRRKTPGVGAPEAEALNVGGDEAEEVVDEGEGFRVSLSTTRLKSDHLKNESTLMRGNFNDALAQGRVLQYLWRPIASGCPPRISVTIHILS